MARGRTANLVPTVQWSIMVPIDLALQIEMKLMDPVTQKAGYAARSKLIQALLYAWLKEQGSKPVVPADLLCPDCKRPKAMSANDVITGACPKHWANGDPDAHLNCARHMPQPEENSSTPEAGKP